VNAWQSLVGALPFEWAQFQFMQHALLGVILIAPLFALLGCVVIGKRMVFFSDAIGHSALTGIAIGVIAGLHDPMGAMLLFAVAIAIVISLLRRFGRATTDTVIGLVMSFSVALGIALLSRRGGFNAYSGFLIGDILTVTPRELGRMALLLGGVVLVWCFVLNPITLLTFDTGLARSRGVRVWLLETLLTIVVAVSVTLTIPWIGILVINSLLVVPAAAARNVAWNTPSQVVLAIAVSVLAGVSGLIVSYYADSAAGATIVLAAMALYGVTLVVRLARR
jgi:zinc transport system permease protein